MFKSYGLDLGMRAEEVVAHAHTPGPETPNQRRSVYNSTFSTSATNRPPSSARKAATTLNTASLKLPMFRMSLRSGAWVILSILERYKVDVV